MTGRRLAFVCTSIGLLTAQVVFAGEGGTAEPYQEALTYAKEQGWMTGYADGSMRSEKILTKAELLKIVLLASGHGDEVARCRPRRTERLTDVPADAWFAKSICVALRLKLIVRPEDGKLHPGKKVSLAEASKIVTLAMTQQEPTQAELWYEPYVQSLSRAKAIPATLVSHKSHVSRGELAEMLLRLKQPAEGRDFANADSILNGSCTWFEEAEVPGVDMDRIKRTWLGWYNDVRGNLGLAPLSYDEQLTRTAFLWSQKAAQDGAITHKRTGQTAYYDYARMTDWFQGYDVTFANIDRITFTENIGWGVFKCPQNADCTDAFTEAVRGTFNFYMSEKGKEYKPHYASIVNPHFRKLGLGIVTRGNTYYLTAHYGTDITSSPAPLCP
jgi:hypothetical protein